MALPARAARWQNAGGRHAATGCRRSGFVVTVRVSEQIVLPVTVEQAWDYFGNVSHLVELDPMLESYEPDAGTLQEGTTNHVVSRLGPLRMRMVTRTAVLDPPHRVVFENVKPSWPLRVRAEDTLTAHPAGTLYQVTITIGGVGPIGRLLARPVGGRMIRTRRQLMESVLLDLATDS